jgi:hypothetical protein
MNMELPYNTAYYFIYAQGSLGHQPLRRQRKFDPVQIVKTASIDGVTNSSIKQYIKTNYRR